jgi:hypothetical protein
MGQQPLRVEQEDGAIQNPFHQATELIFAVLQLLDFA